jgi:hypothetical protein
MKNPGVASMATTAPVTPIEQALELIESLPPEDQEFVIDVVRRRLIERRRREIAANAEATVQAVRERRAAYGTVKDLRRNLAP